MPIQRREIAPDKIQQQRAVCERVRSQLGDGERYAMVDTYGCQQNESDSEVLRGYLRDMGYAITNDEQQADVIVVNTCAVREHAQMRVFGNVGALTHVKREHPERIVVLCGCMAQSEEIREQVKRSYRMVDLCFGPNELWRFPELLERTIQVHGLPGNRGRVFESGTEDAVAEGMPRARDGSVKAWLTIMNGCNNFCSYCIVPYVRGRERSRRPEDILEEVRALAADGVIEVMLLGQNVNSYGRGLEEPVSFAQLLEQVCQTEGIERVRFMTSHPKDLSDELIEVMARSPKVCRHLHLPMQSGSTRILKAMNRRYTKEGYLALAQKIKAAIPDIHLTTDIIVGFPGETEEDFEETLDVVRRVRFDSAFTFIYSPRTGTPAAAMPDQVPPEVVKERFPRLLELVQTIGGEESLRELGQTLPALVEGTDEAHPGRVTGRLSNNVMVHFDGDPSLIGRIVNVKLEERKGFYYLGTMAP